jgi:virulence-associated protein VapD
MSTFLATQKSSGGTGPGPHIADPIRGDCGISDDHSDYHAPKATTVFLSTVLVAAVLLVAAACFQFLPAAVLNGNAPRPVLSIPRYRLEALSDDEFARLVVQSRIPVIVEVELPANASPPFTRAQLLVSLRNDRYANAYTVHVDVGKSLYHGFVPIQGSAVAGASRAFNGEVVHAQDLKFRRDVDFAWPKRVFHLMPGGREQSKGRFDSRRFGESGHVFIGGPPVVTGLHNHGFKNAEGSFHVTLLGKKEVTIYTVDDFHRLYIRPWQTNSLIGSKHPLDAWTIERFPALVGSQPYQAVLKPGDVLRMPDRCFHFFKYLEPTLAVNWFFSPDKIRTFAKLRDAFERLLPSPSLMHSAHRTKQTFQDWAAFERAGTSMRAGGANGFARALCGLNALLVEAAILAVTAAATINEDIALGVMGASMRALGDTSGSVFLGVRSSNGDGVLELGG